MNFVKEQGKLGLSYISSLLLPFQVASIVLYLEHGQEILVHPCFQVNLECNPLEAPLLPKKQKLL